MNCEGYGRKLSWSVWSYFLLYSFASGDCSKPPSASNKTAILRNQNRRWDHAAVVLSTKLRLLSRHYDETKSINKQPRKAATFVTNAVNSEWRRVSKRTNQREPCVNSYSSSPKTAACSVQYGKEGEGQTGRREGFMVVFRTCSKCYYGLRASVFGFSLCRSLKFVTREVHVGSELDELMQRHVLYWKYFDHLLSVVIPSVLRIHLCHPRDGKWAHERPQIWRPPTRGKA